MDERRHELSGGNWLVLKDPETVSYRERRRMMRPYYALQESLLEAATPAELPEFQPPKGAGAFGAPPTVAPPVRLRVEVTDADLDNTDELTQALAVILIESWSFTETFDQVLDLKPARVVDEISTVLLEKMNDLFLDPTPDPDQKSPTPPSSASRRRAGAQTASSSTGGSAKRPRTSRSSASA